MYLRDSDGNLYIRDTYGIPIPLEDTETYHRLSGHNLRKSSGQASAPTDGSGAKSLESNARVSATPHGLVASATNSSSGRSFSNDLVPAALDPGEPELPEGWEKVLHEGSSDIFYCNKELMISQRNNPNQKDPMSHRKYGW